MTRGVLAAGIAALLLAGAIWMVVGPGGRERAGEENAGSAAAYREPEILLNGVEVREIRKNGRNDRVVARRAVYRVLSRNLSAEQVVFKTGDGADTVVVEAPRVFWNMREGRLDLPGGGTARNGSGWEADVPEARIDLPGQVLTADRASLSFPGVRVAGNRLVWEWRSGTVELSSPESRVLPDPLRRGTGKGGEP